MSNNPRNLRPPLISIDDVISLFAEKKKKENHQVRLIQVGANDGKTNDPVHQYIVGYKWKAILVEPQEYVFENELKKTYADCPDAHLENLAIADEEGELPFYKLAFTNERWATGLASFERASLEHQIDRGYVRRKAEKTGTKLPESTADYIEEVKVKVDSFDNIIKKRQFSGVDFLCVDTEGFDYQVLKMFDFEKWRPEMVLFESKNLSDEDFVQAKELLSGHGYRLYWQKGDTLAVRFQIPPLAVFKLKAKAFLQKV